MDITADFAGSLQINVSTKKSLDELNSFLEDWDKSYNLSARKIPMFCDSVASKWNTAQRKFFVKAFYHARGHFHDFLWYMGNHAPDKRSKEIILHNIMEEFGGHACSHETLYINFAKSLGVQDIHDEILNQKTYLPSIKAFNHGHLERLKSYPWDDNLSIFSAYERLDNVDYNNLMKLVKDLGVPERDSVFFKVHMVVEHFETTLSTLFHIWVKNKQTVIDAFSFIASHQLKMWENLSSAVADH